MAECGRKVDLIGVASSLGGADAACAQAPARLAACGLEGRLRRFGVEASWVATLAPKRVGGGVQGAVARLCAALAARVAQSVRGGRLACVIGGDHSCAVGTWSGAATALRRGASWDWSGSTPTWTAIRAGRVQAGGCTDAACRAARAMRPRARGTAGRHAAAAPRLSVGVRSYEAAEAELLERSGVRVFGIEEVVRRA